MSPWTWVGHDRWPAEVDNQPLFTGSKGLAHVESVTVWNGRAKMGSVSPCEMAGPECRVSPLGPTTSMQCHHIKWIGPGYGVRISDGWADMCDPTWMMAWDSGGHVMENA